MPLHPALVHLPIALALLGPFVFIALAWYIARHPAAANLWVSSVVWYLALCVGAYAAMNAGEKDREAWLERPPETPAPTGIRRTQTEAQLQRHKNAGTLLLVSSVFAVFVSSLGLKSGRAGHRARVALGVLSVLLLAIAGYTGKLGGELVFVHGVRPHESITTTKHKQTQQKARTLPRGAVELQGTNK